MFWTEKAIDLLMFLIGLGVVRLLIHHVCPKAAEWKLDILLSAVFVIGFLVSWINSSHDEYERDNLRKSLQEAQEKVTMLNERESLRPWAMVVPTGERATDVLGNDLLPGGTISERHQNVFVRTKTGIGPGSSKCRDQQHTEVLRGLIKDYLKLPYAYMALALCLKHRGDPQWREEAERARSVAEKLLVIQPHAASIDGWYGLLMRDVLEIEPEQTGFFKVYTKNNEKIYVPIGVPQ